MFPGMKMFHDARARARGPGGKVIIPSQIDFEPNSFRAYSGLVIVSLLGAIVRAALDYEPFLQGSKRIIASPGRIKDSHENFLFGM
jgi:hypothetical protein